MKRLWGFLGSVYSVFQADMKSYTHRLALPFWPAPNRPKSSSGKLVIPHFIGVNRISLCYRSNRYASARFCKPISHSAHPWWSG